VYLNQHLDADQARLRMLRMYYAGEQPLAFLSPGDAEKLNGRIRQLAVNVPRLMVRAVADRLAVTGFTSGADAVPSPSLWEVWRRSRMHRRGPQAITEALISGRSYVLVWTGPSGRPVISVESPCSVLARHDPASGEVVAAAKRWTNDEGTQAWATVFEPDKITRYSAKGNSFLGGSVPVSDWSVLETIDNPLGVVPVVPLVHGSRIEDVHGVSVFADLMGLTDALTKTVTDALVASEAYARPRRWATGLQLATEADGAVSEMFDPDADLMLAEEREAKFGQFDASDLAGYAALTGVLTGQISAVSALPPHMVGGTTSTPPSAESLQVALDGLSGRVRAAQASFGDSFGRAMAIADTLQLGGDVEDRLIETQWAALEARSLAASADAAAKLITVGVDPMAVVDKALGWAGTAVTREGNTDGN